MKFARIQNEKCVEFIDFDPTGLYHESLQWEPVPEELLPYVDYSYKFNGSTIVPPNIEYFRDQIKQVIRNMRRAYVEQFPLTFGEHELTCGRTSQLAIASLATTAVADSTATFNFKFDASWQNLTASEMLNLNKAMRDQIQAAFDLELQKYNNIDALTTVADILNQASSFNV